MKNVATYVGIDAHKKELYVAMLVGHAVTPVEWSLPNQPTAVAGLMSSPTKVARSIRRIAGPKRFLRHVSLLGPDFSD